MHSPLEQYLEEVHSHLKELPQQQREEEVEEIRQHIESIVEAHRELGMTEEAAMTSALAQFGTAQTLSKGLTRAFRRSDKYLQGDLKTAAAVAFMTFWTLDYLRGQIAMSLLFAGITGAQLNAVKSWNVVGLIMIPLLQGWLTAIVAPRRALDGIVLSWMVMFGVHIAIGGWIIATPSCMFEREIGRDAAFDVLTGAISVALALLGAQAGVQWKKACLRRLRLA